MSNSNVGMMIVVIIALIAIVFVGAYLVMGDFSNSSSDDNKAQTPESQLSALQNELSTLRQTNFELSNQLSAAQSEIKSLKSQSFFQTNTQSNSNKCNDL